MTAEAAAALSELFEAARSAQENAYAPYSRFPVGAAIRTESGRVFGGCNVENAAYPTGICAETAAIAAMVAAGERRITEVLVIGGEDAPITPCGACRQRLFEFGSPDTVVYSAQAKGPAGAALLGDLLPKAFGPGSLTRGKLAGENP